MTVERGDEHGRVRLHGGLSDAMIAEYRAIIRDHSLPNIGGPCPTCHGECKPWWAAQRRYAMQSLANAGIAVAESR